jgi:Helix-turn-helix domain
VEARSGGQGIASSNLANPTKRSTPSELADRHSTDILTALDDAERRPLRTNYWTAILDAMTWQPISGTKMGRYLPARRAHPADVGLPVYHGRRRTRGLRAEELATLAGISSDYVRLERGRETRPSPAVIDALATAPQLTEDEREHVRSLAALAARPTLRPATGSQGRGCTTFSGSSCWQPRHARRCVAPGNGPSDRPLLSTGEADNGSIERQFVLMRPSRGVGLEGQRAGRLEP